MAGFWATVPTDRVVHLRGASPESVELTLELTADAPATLIYSLQTFGGVPDIVMALLAELDRVARALLSQWLPDVVQRDRLGGASRAAARTHALERAARLGVPRAFLADLAERAISGQGKVRRFAAEVRAASSAKVIATSHHREHLAVVVRAPDDLSASDAEIFVSAGEWLAHHGSVGVWLTGNPWSAVSRVRTLTVQLPRDVEAIAETAEAPAGPAEPAAVFPAMRGLPRWDSPSEQKLERALEIRPWAYGRAWNETYQPDALTSPIRIDLLWREERCAVEVDGPEHRTALRFEVDRRRDVRLQLDGFAVLRFTNAQIDHDLDTVVSQLERFVSGRRQERAKER